MTGIITRSGFALLPPDVQMPHTVECPVCYVDIPGHLVGLSGCAHPLCMTCILQMFASFAHGSALACPLCKANLLKDGVLNLWNFRGSAQFEHRALEFLRRVSISH